MGKNKRTKRTTRDRKHGNKIAPALSPDSPHSVEFFKLEESNQSTIPSLEKIAEWPSQAVAKILPILAAVAEAPPTKFAGGGKWEAMHGPCKGMHEIRIKFNRTHYRLFCVLDNYADGVDKPLLTVLDADSKPNGTVLPPSRYQELDDLRTAYFMPTKSGKNIRSLATEYEVTKLIA